MNPKFKYDEVKDRKRRDDPKDGQEDSETSIKELSIEEITDRI